MWGVIIIVAIIWIVVKILMWIGKGIDRTMDNAGLNENQKNAAWTGLAIWTDMKNKKK